MDDRSDDHAWDAALRGSGDVVRGGGSAGFAAHLDRWVAEARISEAALGRARERWLREVAEQEATLAGVLADLAERQTTVSVRLRGGRRHHGTISAVGADFVVVGQTMGVDLLIRVAAIATVGTAPDVGATIGDRTVGTELRLADVLAELAADRERVVVATEAGELLAGQLRSVGHDVAVLRTETVPPATAYLPLAAIVEVSLG